MADQSSIVLAGSSLGSALTDLLMADDIVPGTEPSYQLCKTIFLLHPLGAKMAESPIKMAQSQERLITIPDSPEDLVRKAFEDEWQAIGATQLILQTMTLSRVYGAASLACGVRGVPTTTPLDLWALPGQDIFFQVFDPLNTAGSMVTNQDPNAPDFQKVRAITVAGQPYHQSRSCAVFNEQPIYISYTPSAFGFVGRSVYQRALFPLKSFVQSMRTDDMVQRKAGVLVAKLKSAGSIINSLVEKAAGLKRAILKEAETDNVINIHVDEGIESLNLQNTDNAMTVARKNIIENVAAAADMPAKLLTQESFAEGFGEGQEDAKNVIRYIKHVREQMQPLYKFLDRIVMHRAWSPEFYATIQQQFPEEYAKVDYKTAFYRWANSFVASWPSLMEEPKSEKAKSDKVRVEGVMQIFEGLAAVLDPENKALAAQWVQDQINEMHDIFPGAPLVLDIEALAQYQPPVPGMGEEGEGGEGGEDGRGGGLRAVK